MITVFDASDGSGSEAFQIGMIMKKLLLRRGKHICVKGRRISDRDGGGKSVSDERVDPVAASSARRESHDSHPSPGEKSENIASNRYTRVCCSCKAKSV